MNQPAEPISLEGAGQPTAADTPTLYLIEDASNCLGRTVPGPGRYDGQCLVCLLPLKPSRVRSSPERRLQLRNSLVDGGASHNAAMLAKNPHFWDYLQQIDLTCYEAEIDARRARHFINRVCGVNGRHELDQEPGTAQRFYTFVQQPFLDWLLSGVST